MSKKAQSNASDEQAPANSEPTVATAETPEVKANDPANAPCCLKVTRKSGVPMVGDSILYTLGQRSRYAGEERAGTITKVIKADENLVQFNVHCATPDDFARNPNMPNWPVAPNTAPYDPAGSPGTWRYLDEEKKAA